MKNNEDYSDLTEELKVSKSQIKRDIEALKKISEYILELSTSKLPSLPLSQTILEAIQEYKRIKKPDAKRRHVQYLTRLIYESPELENIKYQVDLLQNSHLYKSKPDKLLEDILSKILDGDQTTIDKLYADNPTLERQKFQQLLRNTQKEISDNKDLETTPRSQGVKFKKLKSFIRELNL